MLVLNDVSVHPAEVWRLGVLTVFFMVSWETPIWGKTWRKPASEGLSADALMMLMLLDNVSFCLAEARVQQPGVFTDILRDVQEEF